MPRSIPKRLILVRHAEPEFGLPRWCSLERFHRWEADESERSLSERGRVQADDLARRLVGYRPSRLFVSPLPRAVQTAEPLAKACGIEPVLCADLREARFGTLFHAENRLTAPLMRHLGCLSVLWPVLLRIAWLFWRTHGSPTRASVAERSRRVVANLEETCLSDETVALVGHGMMTAFLGAEIVGSGNRTTTLMRFMLKTGEYRILELQRGVFREVQRGRGRMRTA